MSSTNPELSPIRFNDRSSIRPAVTNLFGVATEPIVVAITSYTVGPHGTLDDANLRLIAGAAPLLQPDHVAKLINDLEITEVNLPIVLPPLQQIRAQMEQTLGLIEPASRVRLVRSLIHTATYEAINQVPAGTAPQLAKDLAQAEIARIMAKGDAPAVAQALGSEYVLPIHADMAFKRAANPQIAEALSKCRATTADMLDDMTHINNQRIKLNVARHPSTAPTTLDRQAHESRALATAVASNSAALPFTLEEIYSQALFLVPTEPTRTLEMFSQLVDNPSTWPHTLLYMAQEALNHESLREPVFGRELLMKLAQRPDTPDAALYRIAQTVSGNSELADAIALHPDVSGDTLVSVVPHVSEATCLALVRRTDISAGVLAELAKTNSQRVRIEVAEHPTTDKHTLNNLRYDNDQRVAEMAKTVRTYRRWHGLGGKPKLSPALVITPHAATRPEVAKRQPDLPPETPMPHPALRAIAQVINALEGGQTLGKTSALRTWTDLPASNTRHFDIPAAVRALDGIEVQGLRGELVQTSDRLLAVTDQMGKDLGAPPELVADGKVAILVFDDPALSNTYTAAYIVAGESPRLVGLRACFDHSDRRTDVFKNELKAQVEAVLPTPGRAQTIEL